MPQRLIATAVGALVAVAFAAPAYATPTEDLDRGRKLFQERNWSDASKELNALLYPNLKLTDQDKTVEAHVLFGACEIELGDLQTAHDEFEKALELDPDKSLNALSFSEGAIKLFDDVKVELRVSKERQDERLKAAKAREDFEAALRNKVFYESHSALVSFLPFGFGQFQNDENKKAAAFLIGEVATLGTSAAIYGYLVSTYGLHGTVDPKLHDPHEVRLLQQVEIGTGVVFIGLAIYGVVDSRLNYHSQTMIDQSRLPPSVRDLLPGAAPDKPTKPPPAKKTSLRFGPILVPGGAGVGLAWER